MIEEHPTNHEEYVALFCTGCRDSTIWYKDPPNASEAINKAQWYLFHVCCEPGTVDVVTGEPVGITV